MQGHNEVIACREEVLIQWTEAGAHVNEDKINIVFGRSLVQEKTDRSGKVAESQQRAAKLLGNAQRSLVLGQTDVPWE